MTRLVLQLVRPYRGWLVIVFIAMLAEIAMSLAAPWPLKLVLDDVLEHHKLPALLAWAHDYGLGHSTLGVALFAGLSTLLIALIAAIATYVDNYYTISVGVGGRRPAYPRLGTPASALASLLRQREDRGTDVHYYQR